MPKLTFVIPAYNAGNYLAEAIDSLLVQTLKDIEVIVVDDGSKDETPYLAAHFIEKDTRVQVVGQRNKGRSVARNKGVELAQSPLIAVCDADDVAHPDRAKATYNYFKTHPDVDVFYGSFYVVDMFGHVVDQIIAEKFNYDVTKKSGNTGIGHSTMAYRRRIVLDTPYTDGKFSRLGLDDWKLQLDLYKEGHKFGFTKKHLAKYRFRTSNISLNRDAVDVWKAKHEFFKQHGDVTEEFKELCPNG